MFPRPSFGQSQNREIPSIFATLPKHVNRPAPAVKRPLFFEPSRKTSNIWNDVLQKNFGKYNVSLSSDDSDDDFLIDSSDSTDYDFSYQSSPARNTSQYPKSSLFFDPKDYRKQSIDSDSEGNFTESDDFSESSDYYKPPPKNVSSIFVSLGHGFESSSMTSDFTMTSELSEQVAENSTAATDEVQSENVESYSPSAESEIQNPQPEVKTRSVHFSKVEENESELIQIPEPSPEPKKYETPKARNISTTSASITISSETESDDSMIDKICSRIKSVEWAQKLDNASMRK